MATINAVRLCNVSIDNGDKLIPYNKFNFRSLQSLFLLENGGGKTTFIHLLLQVVLPNTSAGKRSLDETVQQGKNGFVMVEWNLDAKGEQRLITGFSFENRKEAGSGKASLRFYTYMIEYPKGQFSLDDLPVYLVENGKRYVTPYEDFREKVKQIRKVPTDTYNSSSKEVKRYQSDLRKHGIIPEEWENIKEINVSEGAADAFFERTDTVSKLLERLFIPSLEKALFSQDGKSSTLTDAFYKFQENLLKIPEIQKNIKDFEVVENNVEGVIRAVEGFESARENRNQKKDYLLKLSETYHQTIESTKKQITLIQGELGGLEERKNDLQWKLKSYEVFKKQNELKEIEDTLKEVKEEFEQVQESVEKANRKKRELKALRAYNERSDLIVKLMRVKSSIENIEKEDEELRSDLKNRHDEASYSWLLKQNDLNAKSEQLKNEINALSKEVIDLGESNKAFNLESLELSREIGKIEIWLEKFEESRKVLLQWFNEWDLLNPQDCWDQSLAQLDKLTEEKKGHLISNKEAYEKIDELRNQKDKKIEDRVNNQQAINTETMAVNEFHSQKEELTMRLFSYGLSVPIDQNALNESMLSLRNELAEKEDEHERHSNKIRVFSDDLVRLKENPYFVPNNQLEEIKRYLEKKNIFVVLGSEWLSQQAVSESDKEKILNKIPLLPYAILAEGSQMKEISREMNRMEWKNASPIIFLDREVLLHGESDEEGFGNLNLVLAANNTWVYQNMDVGLFMGEDKIESLINQYEEKIFQSKNVLREVKNKRDNIHKTIEKTEEFVSKYSFSFEQSATDTLEFLKEEKEAIQREIDQYENEIGKLNDNIIKSNEQLEFIESELEQVQDKVRLVKEFVSDAEKETEKTKLLNGINSRLREIKREITINEKRSDEITPQMDNLKAEKLDIEHLLKQHKKDKEEYHWKSIELYGPSVDYYLAKGLYQSIKEDLNRKHEGLEELQNDAKDYEKYIQRQDIEIEENEIDLMWLEKNKRTVHLDEIKRAASLEKEINNQQGLVKKKVDGVQSEYDNSKGSLNAYVTSIIVEFKKESYEYKSDIEYHRFVYEESELLNQQDSLLEEVALLEESKTIYDKAYEVLKSNLPGEIVNGVVDVLSDFVQDVGKLVHFTNQEIEKFKKLGKQLGEAKDLVNKRFNAFKSLLEATDNNKIKQLGKQFDLLLTEERLFNADYVIDKFARVLEASGLYKDQLEQTQVEVEKDRKQLIEMAIRRVQAIYDRIVEMPKSSRLNLYGKEMQAIRLRWERLRDDESKSYMSRHIQSVVEDINKMLSEGSSEESIQRYIQSQLDTKVLMKCYAPFHQCRVDIYKPKKEHIMIDKSIEYSPWEIAVKWSGGEQYTVYMTMFMVYIMHIRQAADGREKEPFTIVVDNPFGKASNDHIVDPILETAKKNNIQLICLTAHDTPRIIKKFPVVYSNVYNYEPNAKVEILESEFKETLETLKYVNDNEMIEQPSFV
jgi:hypothetical protein